MGIAEQPVNTNKVILQSTEGLNLDIWQGLDLSKFLPPALQRVIDEITKLLNKVQAMLEYALEAIRLLSSAVSEIFTFVKAVIEQIRKTIMDLLDLFPHLDAGIYMLYIPLGMGGNNYYLSTYKDSLEDSNDLRRPPNNPNLKMEAMFFMWSYPWFDEEKKRTVRELTTTVKNLFPVSRKFIAHEYNEVDLSPKNVMVTQGFYPKEKSTHEYQANKIKLPTLEISNETTDEVQQFIRTSIDVVTRTSDTAAIGYNIRWTLPKECSRVTLKHHEYYANHNKTQLDYSFSRKTYQVHGIYILRSTSTRALEVAIKRINSSTSSNNPVVNVKPSELHQLNATEKFYTVTTGHKETVDLISVPAWRVRLVNFYTDYPVDQSQAYYYAVATAYTVHIQSITAYPSPTGNGYTILKINQLNPKDITTMGSPVDIDIIDNLDFSVIHPQDVKYYKKLTDEELDSLTVVPSSFSTPSGGFPLAPYSSTGNPPDWMSFSLFEDLFPEIKEVIEKIKRFINNVIDSILDDISAFEEWVQAQIRKIESIIQDAIDFINKLKSLIFPPMAGIHYLNISTNQGVKGVTTRLENSLKYALLPTSNSYNPVLLDVDFQKENPEEFKRRQHIPAYDRNHVAGGMVLLFQEPSVKNFLRELFQLDDAFTDEFKKVAADTRLRLRNLSLPNIKYEVPLHPMVELSGKATSPDEYMNNLSEYKAGQQLDDPKVNSDGNVEEVSKKGPFIFTQPTIISIATEEGKYKPTVLPHGTLSAEEIVTLISQSFKDSNLASPAFALGNGSFMLEGKELHISPCSSEAATILGLEAGLSLKVPTVAPYSGQFSYDDGDYLVEFIDEGPPTVEMLRSTPPIFQYNQANLDNLSPSAYYLKFTIEDTTKIIDVTGNLGKNPTNSSATWTFTASYPLQIQKDQNDKFNIQITTTNQTLINKYKNTNSEWSTALQEFAQKYGESFSNSPENAMPEINQTVHEVTIPAATYDDPYTLGVAILTTLHGHREVDVNPSDGDQNTVDEQAAKATRIYPLGLLTVAPHPVTIPNNTIPSSPRSLTASLKFLDVDAHTAETTLQVTAATNHNFLATITSGQNVLGTTKALYTLQNIVANLNASYPTKNYFSVVDGDKIRITGQKIGKSHSITVHCANTPIQGETQSFHYSNVATSLFGIPNQQYNLQLFGIGDEMLSKSYFIGLEITPYCISMEDNIRQITEIYDTPSYIVEIEDRVQQEYLVYLENKV